jgi:NAD(P)-dependent dehydrogenase (short-subunit alcohol dehydrogenase family)
MSKTAIVTGASGNLGQAVVRKMISDGFTVFGTRLPNDPVIEGMDDGKYIAEIVDLSGEDHANNFIQTVIDKNKTIEAAVLTVGGFAMGSIAETKTSDINKQSELNFITAYNSARPIFMQMVKQGYGRIFLIGSIPGSNMKKGKGMVSYSLAKSMIFRLAELMNDESKGTNVVVAVIVPSTIDTPQNRQSMPKADFSKWVKPEAIAEVIGFYCSDAAGIIREPVIKVFGNS